MNLLEEEKNFETMELWTHDMDTTELTSNIFADITFKEFYGRGIQGIRYDAFGKSAFTITKFSCLSCQLQSFSPQMLVDDVWKTLSTLVQVKSLSIGLNVNQIPTYAIEPIDKRESKLEKLIFYQRNKNVTIERLAFGNLKNLKEIHFELMNIIKFKRSSLSHRSANLKIIFKQMNLDGDSFEKETFNGNKGSLDITFYSSNITYLPESSFKSLLMDRRNTVEFYNKRSEINFIDGIQTNFIESFIDCENCGNVWLITNSKQNQVINAFCKHNPSLKLFDTENYLKLFKICKSDDEEPDTNI